MSAVISYMLLVVETGGEHSIIKEIKKIKGVTECRAVYGEFDIFVRLEVADLTVLDSIVTQVRQLPGVSNSKTLVGSP